MATSNDFTVKPELVRTLATLLDETSLTEIEYSVGESRIRVVRSAAPTTTVAMAAAPVAAAPAVAAVPAGVTPDHPGAVKSPMVGTAYLSPQPSHPTYVKVGDRIAEGQVLMIIEAMKVMNQIRAPRGGQVREILVSDGVPVEFGQVLMVLE